MRSWVGAVGVATYGSLCDGDMWGESGRVGCIRSRVLGMSVGVCGLDRCGWTRESGGGRVRGGWTDGLVYLMSVGG